jgi:oxygen-independent coproporphyrinogen-3 oxidase
MTELMECTHKYFKLLNDDTGEYSIEVHPGLVSIDTISHLRRIGFNRLSIGVQDFNPATQQAVNRFNSFDDVNRVVERAREESFHSISMDLIYGLPYQSLSTLVSTLRQIIELSPERLSLFNYAHMPHMFKVQKQIDEASLPSAQEKLRMLKYAIETLVGAGYVYIGMDHFAKPSDELAIAQKNGELQRGFQGYSTRGDTDLVAFGVSSISFVDNVYVQNYKNLDDYNQAIDTQKLPIARGYALLHDDQVRRKVIHQLICQFVVKFADIEKQFDIDFVTYFAKELALLEFMAKDGIVTVDCDRVRVENSGRLLIRRICMVFDAYIAQATSKSFSKII